MPVGQEAAPGHRKVGPGHTVHKYLVGGANRVTTLQAQAKDGAKHLNKKLLKGQCNEKM